MTPPPPQQSAVTVRTFVQLLSPTERGARLARQLALHQCHEWGILYGSEISDAVAQIVAELAANAVTHGRVRGRDFELRLVHLDHEADALLRIEVSDARGERRLPEPGALREPAPGADSGRGLLLVEALADRWCVRDREFGGKTVRAEIDIDRTGRW
ncbi:ATP-binding protein [Streptomyces sp. NPDC048442]|uniref:ATP-binding protein n=1 Tax=Streptomyces sp. NPDC048442 TaxID=3154823 RepID=UPI003440F92B